MGIRHDAREWALQFLFQSEFNQAESLDKGFELFWGHVEDPAPADGKDPSRVNPKGRRFTEELVRGVIAHHPDIDPLIAKYADNWGIDRMGTVDRNAMRIAVYEMLYRDDIPPVVSINEAVDLAKSYSSVESGKFVNGILDRIRKGLDRPAREPKDAKKTGQPDAPVETAPAAEIAPEAETAPAAEAAPVAETAPAAEAAPAAETAPEAKTVPAAKPESPMESGASD
jgi:transcription antitermination protein NusB